MVWYVLLLQIVDANDEVCVKKVEGLVAFDLQCKHHLVQYQFQVAFGSLIEYAVDTECLHLMEEVSFHQPIDSVAS